MYLKINCKCCGIPALEVFICGGEKKHPVFICDECDAMWITPTLEGELLELEGEETLCPHGDGKLFAGDAHPATEDEIILYGLKDYIDG